MRATLKDTLGMGDAAGDAMARRTGGRVLREDGDKMRRQAMAPATSGVSTATAAKRRANVLGAAPANNRTPPSRLELVAMRLAYNGTNDAVL